MKFNFNDIFMFDVIGQGELFDYLTFQYKYFESDDESMTSKFCFSCNNDVINKIKIERKYTDKKESFSYSKCGKFVWHFGKEVAVFSGKEKFIDQNIIYFSENFPKMMASMIVDFIIRINLTSSDMVLLHSAALANASGGILIPSWKGMGKTALTLKLVQSGYMYLADDRMWLTASGVIYAYPRYVVLKKSNFVFFPEFTDMKIRFKIHLGKMLDFCLKNSSILSRLSSYLFKVKPQHHYITDLIPTAKVINECQLGTVLTLHRENINRTIINKFPSESASKYADSVNKYEWDSVLSPAFFSHDALFYSCCSWKDEHEKLLLNDRKVLKQAFFNIPAYEVLLPIKPSIASFDDLINKIDEL